MRINCFPFISQRLVHGVFSSAVSLNSIFSYQKMDDFIALIYKTMQYTLFNERKQTIIKHINPRCWFYILLSLDQKGVANIYKVMLGKNRNILTETSHKWNETMNLDITTFVIGRSLNKISIIDEIYLRYIQFRTLTSYTKLG